MQYIKHLVLNTAKHGWNVVVYNHRGLGGVSITSDCFYNAGWTNDTRDVMNHLHQEYPKAPLFAIGTSIGANILIYSSRLVQKLYDRVLTIGLQGYARLNQPHFSRLADWEGNVKSRSILDFDLPVVMESLRANKNVVLATTKHGGHLAFFEGMTASGLWWVRAVNEFLSVLHSSPYMHTQKKVQCNGPCSALDSLIDQGPYVNLSNGMVSAMGKEPSTNNNADQGSDGSVIQYSDTPEMVSGEVLKPTKKLLQASRISSLSKTSRLL